MMLILKRGWQERFLITLEDGREIWITLLDSNGVSARIGIDAPHDVRIRREEILPAAGGTSSGLCIRCGRRGAALVRGLCTLGCYEALLRRVRNGLTDWNKAVSSGECLPLGRAEP